ncbi:MAG: DUF4251 domain-containing protein [Bacteroidaceae bacterium]|nr:DUF4251 domain-containing protein [Bacteroidaceae bacterium]
MKRVFYFTLLFCVLCGTASYAQHHRSARGKAWRAEREELRARERAMEQQNDSAAYRAALEALQQGDWVLEADNINFFNGITRFVSSTTNYISCNDGEGTVQTAYANFVYSPNGLGGVTVLGDVSGGRMSTDKDGNVYCSFSIQGSAVSATVYVTLTGGTNQASATVNPNFSGRSMTFNGYLVPYDKATVFQGMPQW